MNKSTMIISVYVDDLQNLKRLLKSMKHMLVALGIKGKFKTFRSVSRADAGFEIQIDLRVNGIRTFAVLDVVNHFLTITEMFNSMTGSFNGMDYKFLDA